MKKYIALAFLMATLVACEIFKSPISPIIKNPPCKPPKAEVLQKEFSSRGTTTTTTADGDIYKKGEFVAYFEKTTENTIKNEFKATKKSETLGLLQSKITEAIASKGYGSVEYETCECASFMLVRINGDLNAPTEIVIMNIIRTVAGVDDVQPNIIVANEEYKLATNLANGTQVQNVTPVQDKDIIVGVIDSGISFEKMQSNFPENIYYKPNPNTNCPPVQNDYYGYDWVNTSTTIIDSTEVRHGSNITLDILETYYTAKGSCKGLKILPIKSFNKNGVGSQYSVACGIYYAVNRGAKLINASFGFKVANKETVSALKKAVLYAQDKNTLIITSAGNDNCTLNREYGTYPAIFNSTDDGIKNIITVSSVVKQNSGGIYYVPNYANRNSEFVHITARSDTRNRMELPLDDLQRNGTSYATGYVTGYAASLISLNNNLDYITLRQNILSGTYVIQNQQNLLPYCENGRMLTLGF